MHFKWITGNILLIKKDSVGQVVSLILEEFVFNILISSILYKAKRGVELPVPSQSNFN